MSGRLTVISRKSPLALKQVEEVMSLLPGVPYTVLALDSLGDKNKDVSLLEDDPPADFFTRELDEALLAGEGDAAVHSAKDLPFPLPARLVLAALTRPVDPLDCLVTRDGRALADLPPGAMIGVSSQRRRDQLLALRPDLALKSIRGTIEERLERVHSGEFDGAIVAACALKRLGRARDIAQILPFATHPLQGMLAAVVREDRRELLALFAAVDFRREFGKVVIAGAGPGDPELLTLKARRALAEAGTVVYDDLVHPDVVAGMRAEKVYAGKRKGRRALEQEEIQELLYERARAGKKVVRLKGGDPLLFARTAEEVRYLAERHIEAEIIPGVSSAQGAASRFGIPLTMRAGASSAAFASAHRAGDKAIRIPGGDTLVFFMASSRLSELSQALLAAGRGPETPVGLARGVGFPFEELATTTVREMAGLRLASPLIVLVGEIVRRAPRRGAMLYTGLSVPIFSSFLHDRVIHYPLIRVVRTAFSLERPLAAYDAVVFTSRNAAGIFLRRHRLRGQNIFAIGNTTAAAIRRFGYGRVVLPEKPESDSLARLLASAGVGRGLYPCSRLSRNLIHELSTIERLEVYDVVPRPQPVRDLSGIDGVFFTAPSAVASFASLYPDVPRHLVCYAQGPHTAEKLAGAGVERERIIDVQAIART